MNRRYVLLNKSQLLCSYIHKYYLHNQYTVSNKRRFLKVMRDENRKPGIESDDVIEMSPKDPSSSEEEEVEEEEQDGRKKKKGKMAHKQHISTSDLELVPDVDADVVVLEAEDEEKVMKKLVFDTQVKLAKLKAEREKRAADTKATDAQATDIQAALAQADSFLSASALPSSDPASSSSSTKSSLKKSSTITPPSSEHIDKK